MRLWIQRRNTILQTASPADQAWISASIDADGLWLQLGWPTPFGAAIAGLMAEGVISSWVVRRQGAEAPSGFALLFPVADAPEKRELVQATPRPQDRDAFTALNAFDAILYAAFEVLALRGLSLRIRSDNPQPQAILRRIGIQPSFEIPLLGSTYRCTEIDAATWERRLAKLRARDPEPFSRGADEEQG